MLKNFVTFVLRPQWVAFVTKEVVSDLKLNWVQFICKESNAEMDAQKELGLKIWGFIFGLYKGNVLMYRAKDCFYRATEKREFGESLHAS